MPDYLMLTHDDGTGAGSGGDWERYIGTLRAAGRFQGGSEIGDGVCVRKAGAVPGTSAHLTGFLRVVADDLAAARTLLEGHPVYERGGTVEIRELPQTG